MRPDTELTIYEIRVAQPGGLEFLAGPPEPEERFGPDLAGLHFEADFAFLFFINGFDLKPFLAQYPFLELRRIHCLRYDQWQDGATMEPMTMGPLKLWPWPDQVSPGIDQLSPTPPAEECPPIYIDPGLAFGFGGHPTTRACLSFLIRLYKPKALGTLIPVKALDLGSGTGVLSLAAARLGAQTVLGVDYSHLAVRCANRNAELNGLSDKAHFERGLAQDYARIPAELVMANLPLFVLKDLIDLGAFHGRRHLIFSGLLADEGDIFLDALTSGLTETWKLVDSLRDDRWVSGLVEF
ncbi:MAG: 50S ribosomal protein L11 methyltransferase [Deltaproteobacteria bacterium]|nr:50S ribosomal protein L11 methyltransferase [Deltaproteobacteria bacterium]